MIVDLLFENITQTTAVLLAFRAAQHSPGFAIYVKRFSSSATAPTDDAFSARFRDGYANERIRIAHTQHTHTHS